MGFANWIKFSTDTPEKPEILEIAGTLDIDPDAVVGKLIRIWIWYDQHTVDGNAASVTSVTLMKRLDMSVGVTGFCKAAIKAGWMMEEDGKLILPNFDRHNGETAKRRAQTANRVQKNRAKKRNDVSVTKALPEEEEEEDIKKDSSTKSPKKVAKKVIPDRKKIPPTLEMVTAYCAERGNGISAQEFIDHYTTNDWHRGKTKIKDWQAAIRTWEQQRKNGNGSGQTTRASGGSGKTSAREHTQQINDYLDAELAKEMGGPGA